eukprot:c8264_g1_i2.p1 GENE.c8264_g1_i2~~c8264_g1_i2.p1  ORF type:complete len:160 (+),score=15.11 c8264_g1_i2:127-606(+)
MNPQFRPPKRDECDALVELGNSTGIFSPGEAQELLGQTLSDLLDENLPSGHQAHVLVDDATIKGWVYFGPTEHPTVWNLWWIGVDPSFKGQGFGKQLLRFVEESVKANLGRYLIIETSSSDQLRHTRDFYKLQGYDVSHTEPDGYGPAQDKVVFKKQLD